MCTTLYSVTGTEITEKRKQNQKATDDTLLKILQKYFFKKKMEGEKKDFRLIKTLAGGMYTCGHHICKILYLLASETKWYFGTGTNNNL